jgi:hypothetical protein
VGDIISIAQFTSVLIGLLPLLVIAVWLWKMENKINGKPILWAIGAIFLNYWIMLLFIGQRILERENNSEEHTT